VLLGNVESQHRHAAQLNTHANSYAERWVRSVKEECLSRLILVGESSLRRALQQYTVHYHEERNHQGKSNRILFPSQTKARRKEGAVRCRERLGGLLKYYEREAVIRHAYTGIRVDATAGDGLTISTYI
jgi:site-specific recombinase XerD